MVSACASLPPVCKRPAEDDVVYVVGEGWHAEIGIPVTELDGGLEFYRNVFPGARVLMFGYGKRTFITAPPNTFSEYILGPVPGPALIQVVALKVTPPEAYPPENTVTLALPPGGHKALSKYIWQDLLKDTSARPQIVSRSNDPIGLLYAANSEYNLFHTCNTWTADALHAAGLTISGDEVIFSGQVMTRVNRVAEDQCQ